MICDVKNVFGFWVSLLHQSKSEGLFHSSLLLNFSSRVFSYFSSQVFLPSSWNMASLHSQWEIVPIELPNPEETQIWELLLIIATFSWQARIGCHVSGLTDIQKTPPKSCFWQHRLLVIRNSCKRGLISHSFLQFFMTSGLWLLAT